MISAHTGAQKERGSYFILLSSKREQRGHSLNVYRGWSLGKSQRVCSSCEEWPGPLGWSAEAEGSVPSPKNWLMWDGLCQPHTGTAHNSALTDFNQSLSAAELNNQPVVGTEQSQISPGILKGPWLAAGLQGEPCLSDAVVSVADMDSGFLLPSMSTVVMLENGESHLGSLPYTSHPQAVLCNLFCIFPAMTFHHFWMK